MQIPRRPDVHREMGASDESIRKWIESSKKAEAKLDFNSKYKEFNGHVHATWDAYPLLKDVISATAQFVPSAPVGFHGRFSQAMIGSTVPGQRTNEYQVIAVRTFNDNKPDHISNHANKPSANFTKLPDGLDDGGNDKDLVGSLRKMLGGDKQTKQDIDVREFGKYRGWRAAV